VRRPGKYLALPRAAAQNSGAMKRALITLLSLAALFTVHADDTKVLATTPDLHKGTEGRINQFNKISKKGEAQLVFLGDSITHGWEGQKAIWEAAFGQYKPANFGIGGDRTEHVLWRMDNGNFDGLKPKLTVIMIGTNNTGHRKGEEPAEQTCAGVKAIIERLAKKCPDSKVLLLGIFPRGEKPDDKLRKHNAAINELLAKLADGKKVQFLDIGKNFLQPDGTLSKEIMPDLLHLSPKGYQIWADSIKDKVAEMMK
jgi:lysophospholipase L1-like esterase